MNVGTTWQGDFGKTYVQTSFDGYYNWVKDMIVAVPYNMFVWNCVNVGKVRVYGADITLNASYQLNGHQQLTASGCYSYQRAQNRTNSSSPYYKNQIAYMPEHQVSVALAWENPCVSCSTHLTAVSDRWTTNAHLQGTRVDGYYELGVSAYHRFHLGRGVMEARLDVKNVTDKQYEIVGAYPMPGRSYQVSLNYKL